MLLIDHSKMVPMQEVKEHDLESHPSESVNVHDSEPDEPNCHCMVNEYLLELYGVQTIFMFSGVNTS